MNSLLLPLQEPIRLIHGALILLGLWMIAKLFWMCYYEYKYYRNAGEDYLNYGKEYVKEQKEKV